MSDRQRIVQNERDILENKSILSRILGILNDGLVTRITRIENRMWSLMIGLLFILITVISELIYIIIRSREILGP